MFHLRQTRGLEIDLLVQEGDRLIATEAKSGATISSDFFKHLRGFAADVAARDSHLKYHPRIVFGGTSPQCRTDGRVIFWQQIQEVDW
ncbi:MAG: hypothetical protein KDD47_05885 [Acidobacteria bacterium]|nr:hypothetical protein [Acidobacteriota bacterium]